MKEAVNQTLRRGDADAMQWIRDYLRQRPWASATDVSQSLRTCGVEMSPDVAGALLVAIKTG